MSAWPLLGLAQDYVPITTPGTQWLYLHVSPFGDEDWQTISITDEVQVDGHAYRRLNYGNDALRDDNGKVWYYPLDGMASCDVDSLPLLLYDFGLQVGDTFHLPLDHAAWRVITERDSVLMANGTFRTRITLGNGMESGSGCGCGSFTWIEGLGDADFMLNPVAHCFELGMNLECYRIGNTGLYGNCTWQGIEAARPVDTTPLIATDQRGLYSWSSGLGPVIAMKMIDASGRAVPFSASMSGVDISYCPAGLYLVEGDATSGLFFQRLVLAP